MKAFKTLMLLLALGLSAYGQAVNVTANKIKGSATAPSGSCSAQQVQLTTAGVVYVCSSGTWASSGGGTTINGTDGFVPVRTNSTTFGNSAFASNALNSTYLSATSGASGAGLTLSVAGGGANENLKLTTKGTGQVLVPDGAAATPGWAYASAPGLGSYNIANVIHGWTVAGSLVATLSSSVLNVSSATGQIILGSDVGLTRHASGVARLLSGASTTAGQLLIGTSTGTADAQLSVYSQSTTRPGLKLRALSGTSSTQTAFENYGAAGALNAQITSDGKGEFYSLSVHAGSGIGTSWAEIGASTLGVAVGASGNYSWSGTAGNASAAKDLLLERDAANTLAQRNGTNAQAFRVYNTYTSGSNYERLGIQASSNAFFITPEAATGTVRELVTGAAGSVTRLRSSLATPSAPSLANGDWWVECIGSSPSRVCAIMVRDGGATRTIASMTY